MEQQDKNFSRFKSALEVLAVAGPIICLVDCVAIPLALLVLPLFGVRHVCHGLGDQLMAFLVLTLCAPSLIPGFLKHRKKRVLALMIFGFAAIFLANFAGAAIDGTVHIVISVLGSLSLIKANLDNKRFNKCSCHSRAETVPVLIESDD